MQWVGMIMAWDKQRSGTIGDGSLLRKGDKQRSSTIGDGSLLRIGISRVMDDAVYLHMRW